MSELFCYLPFTLHIHVYINLLFQIDSGEKAFDGFFQAKMKSETSYE